MNLSDSLLSGLPELPTPDYLPEKELQSLIQELVLRTAPEEEVLKAYKLSHYQFKRLQQTPQYQEQFKKVSEYVRGLGPNASFVLKARALAEDQIGTIGNIVSDIKTDPAVRVQMMKELVKWGGLFNEKEGATNVGGGVNISFNFGNLKPLKNVKEVN